MEVCLGGNFIARNLPDNLDPEWRTALLSAENQWNDAALAFRERVGTPGIIDVEVADLGEGTASTFARATHPPEPKITLNARYSNRCATSINLLPLPMKTYTSLHEMGHVLASSTKPQPRRIPERERFLERARAAATRR